MTTGTQAKGVARKVLTAAPGRRGGRRAAPNTTYLIFTASNNDNNNSGPHLVKDACQAFTAFGPYTRPLRLALLFPFHTDEENRDLKRLWNLLQTDYPQPE